MKSNKNKNTNYDPKKLTANESTDVQDIKNNLLYTKSGYTLGYLRILPTNVDLLSMDEKESLCNQLTAHFSAIKDDFTFLSVPRTVDMEDYLNYLNDKYDGEIENPHRKMILEDMLVQASKTIIDGNNFEHQFYIKVWSKYNLNVSGTERQIQERLSEIEKSYASVKNPTRELNDTDILKVCNLYCNSNTASMENYDNVSYLSIPRINTRGNYEK